MKKLIIILSLAAILAACAFPAFLPEVAVKNFVDGLEDQDIDVLMSAYYANADFLFTAPDGSKDSQTGIEEIRAAQAEGFEDTPVPPEVSIIDWTESADGESVVYRLIASFGDMELLNTLTLTPELGIWGILHQTVVINQQ